MSASLTKPFQLFYKLSTLKGAWSTEQHQSADPRCLAFSFQTKCTLQGPGKAMEPAPCLHHLQPKLGWKVGNSIETRAATTQAHDTTFSTAGIDVKMSRNRFLSLLFLWCHDWCTAKLLELTVTVSLQSKAICQVQIQNSLHCIPIQIQAIQVKSHLPNSNAKQLSLPAFHFKFKSKAICHSCLFSTQYQLPVSTLTGSLHQPP